MFWSFKIIKVLSNGRSALVEKLMDTYLIDIPARIAGARTLCPPPGSMTAFDHRIMHRGTPALPSKKR